MSYTAKSLEEIAELFEEHGAACQRRANRGDLAVKEAAKAEGQSTAWLQAAGILRRTTITEPIHMEKP